VSVFPPPVDASQRPQPARDSEYQPLENQLELFYTDTSGALALLFKAQNHNWMPAFRL
jgi:hypothetical protein